MVDNAVILLLSKSVHLPSDSSETDTLSDQNNIIQSSESEYENDQIVLYPLVQYLSRARNKPDDYLHIIDSWSDAEFNTRLRISRKTAFRLIDEMDKSGVIPTQKFGLKPLQAKLCFYIFLSFLASSDPLTPIATRFDISVSSTFRVIRRVIAWLLTKLNEVVKWPQDYTQISTKVFEAKTGIPNIIGVIDCTHIRITKPRNAREYCNTKGYYSIVLQATVDANLCFTNIFCGEPGSSSACRVLKKSPLFLSINQEKELILPENTFLIGHSRYPSLQWLITPCRDNKKLTTQQKEFNSIIHNNVRKISGKAFSMLKHRFKRLKHFTVYRDIAFITDTVVAACILHNYCLCEKLDCT